MVDWEDVRHLVALAKAGTLSGAARALGVDHATVGRRIASLERSLETTLVERTLKGYRLTTVGRQVADSGVQMQLQAETMQRITRAARSVISGSVRVSVPPGLATHFLVPRLGIWRELHPELHLEVVSETSIVSLGGLEADIAIRLRRPDEPNLAVRRVGRMAFGIYATQDYLLRRKPESWEFIAFDPRSAGAAQQDWLLRFAGNRPIVFRTNDLATQLAAVHGGVGLAALPHFFVENVDVSDVKADYESLFRDIWLVVHTDLRKAPAVRAVVEMIAGIFKSYDLRRHERL